LVVNTQESV